MSLNAHGVSWHAGAGPVVDGVTLDVEPGQTLGLLGPNGSGKSSLLRLLAGVRRTSSGVVRLDERPLSAWPSRTLARRLATMGQHAQTDVDVTVADVVALGRVPHQGAWRPTSAADRAAVDAACAAAGIGHLRGRTWRTLSGGEQQRTQLARALAQEPTELLLDEPTNHLDISHQLELLALVRALPVTTVVALHDLNLAAQFCDSVAVLVEGRLRAHGPTTSVLTEALIAEVYDVRSVVGHDPATGRPWVRFLPPG
ncbi:ABC transporter ATP-binding protein [Nocardioides zeae]|uniref:ABC transporter ATP-binding protein n=1 Tax=Nocardioides imazamoxiresistens TaxID=3231893 RepID=A0ABU3Q0B4_9ACTN|nr:ABC transporter ATP-binding protein [Nocardioides zeae]MDT9594950.1 ABC transporter ATP-binding protein [Nocardioides zeae]